MGKSVSINELSPEELRQREHREAVVKTEYNPYSKIIDELFEVYELPVHISE